MAFEVACSQCEGRLMVEAAGVVVACPHCGAHLNIEAPSESEPSTDVTAETVEQEGSAAAAPINNEPEPDDADSSATEAPINAPTDETAPKGNNPSPQLIADPEPAQVPTTEFAANATLLESQPIAQSQPAGEAIAAPSIVSVSAGRGISRHTFTLVRNYAIAMTLTVIFLIYKLLNPNMSALESLPDVKPQKKDNKIVYKLVPEATEMPPGHLLSLGQSQRFGNLQVTPVRVTKEPVEFVHHLGDTGVTREPGPEVVKLWFEFENLSTDQSIAPLDGLVFKRDDNDFENVRSNNFACRLSQKKKGGELAFVYDLNEFDIWNLRAQNAEQEIAPGEKLTTYIPTTEEGVAQLLNSDEPLIWRVQFRKGYSRKNYGVTTVIEVAFESADIGAKAAVTPETVDQSAEEAA
jgi:hypothetical protein